MGKWTIVAGFSVVLGGLGALLAYTNPTNEAFETYAIEQVKRELCPQVPLGLAQDCPRLVDENQETLKGWIRRNTESQNFGLFSQYETTLSVRELVPEPARPFLGLMPLPEAYRLRTIGVLGRFVIYGAESRR